MASILIFGVGCDDALALALSTAFGPAISFVEALPGSDSSPAFHLAIGVCAKGDEQRGRAFDEWAQSRRIPALTVKLGADEAFIGPLALPGRPGCGQCASARLTAAAAAARFMSDKGQTSGIPPESVDIARVSEVLVSEIGAILRDGLEKCRLLDHILVVSAHSKLEAANLHRVIPLSRCGVCGGAAAFTPTARQSSRLSAEDSPETVLEALSGWVDPRTGVISRLVVELPHDTQMETPIVVTASPPYALESDGSLRRLPIGWGKGLTLPAAILSAVGEAIERYAPSLPDHACVIWERPEDLHGEYLDPRVFSLYTDEQYERERSTLMGLLSERPSASF